jgi:hypothetical protein
MALIAHYDVDRTYFTDIVGLDLQRNPREGTAMFTLLRKGIPAEDCPQYVVKGYSSVDDVYAFADKLIEVIQATPTTNDEKSIDVDMLHMKIHY